METLATDLISLLRYLLPGFLSAWVFYGFTSFQKPSQFERVVQALIFTIIIQPFVFLTEELSYLVGRYAALGNWTSESQLAASVVTAVLLGIIFAYFSNNDKFHKIIRNLNVSRETSYPSEWYGEFSNTISYVVLHLEGERRIYGWPKEWPSTSDKGHFSLLQAAWLDGNKEIPLTGVDVILIPATDVKMVEFMQKSEDITDG